MTSALAQFDSGVRRFEYHWVWHIFSQELLSVNCEGLSSWSCLTVAGILVQYIGNDRPILSCGIFSRTEKNRLELLRAIYIYRACEIM